MYIRHTRPLCGGAGSATLRVGRDILKEEGVGTFLKETAIEALPFSGSAEYTGRYRKILSIDEEDGLKDRMNKARAWQQERDSAFWGEKFLRSADVCSNWYGG